MKKKTIAITILAIVTSVLISSILFYTLKSSYDIEEIEKDIKYLKSIILDRDYKNEDYLKKELEKFSKNYDIGIKILDKAGTSELLNIQERKIIYQTEFSDENLNKNIELYYYDKDNLNRFLRISLNSIMVSVTMALLFINRFVMDDEKNYKSLIMSMEKNIRGESNKLKLKGRDRSVRQVEETYNKMSQTLKDNIEKSKKLNIQLGSIISSMDEAIIAVDNSYKLIFNNDLAKHMLNLNENIKYIYEIENEEIKKASISLIDKKVNNDIYIDLKYPILKNIKISHSDIRDYEYSNRKIGDLIIIEDITDMKKLQKIQRDFVTNISHELKTPMTSVIGFIETIIEDDFKNPDITRRFLHIIDEEMIRMDRLLEDLLVLSAVERVDYEIDYEVVDLVNLIESIFNTLDYKAKLKGIELQLNHREKEILVLSNNNNLRQILMNLIDNSIKYNKEQGFVVVTPYITKDYMYIDILDNGMGIDKDQQARIFERFYRIDQSRSTEIYGTGLGLSIVRHLVSIFNGSIYLKSKKNIGTLVTIKIPLNKVVK